MRKGAQEHRDEQHPADNADIPENAGKEMVAQRRAVDGQREYPHEPPTLVPVFHFLVLD